MASESLNPLTPNETYIRQLKLHKWNAASIVSSTPSRRFCIEAYKVWTSCFLYVSNCLIFQIINYELDPINKNIYGSEG